MPSRRIDMLNEQFKREISEIVQRELRDPRVVGLVSITNVEITNDLRHATVFVSVLGGQPDREAAVASLTRAAGFIRHELATRLTLRYTPDLAFRPDVSIERGNRIMGLIREITPTEGSVKAESTEAEDGPESADRV